MAHEFVTPVIGQEAVCPDGLGRVIAFKDAFPEQWIQVDTYVSNRGCKWAPENVKLVEIRYADVGCNAASSPRPKLIEMGQITTLDPEGDRFDYPMALLITFDSVEAIRQAIHEGRCEFSFGEQEDTHAFPPCPASAKSEDESVVMQRGVDLEPVARELYQQSYGTEVRHD